MVRLKDGVSDIYALDVWGIVNLYFYYACDSIINRMTTDQNKLRW